MKKIVLILAAFAFVVIIASPAEAQTAGTANAGQVEAIAAAGQACLCKCKLSDEWWGWHYYEPAADGSCTECTGCCVHDNALGDITDCRKVPRPIQTAVALESEVMSLEEFLNWLDNVPDAELEASLQR